MMMMVGSYKSHIPEDGIFHSHCRENLKSVAFSPQANYTDRCPLHVGEDSAKFCG
jgi:hypothetical protein